jgi:hypothetical protein
MRKTELRRGLDRPAPLKIHRLFDDHAPRAAKLALHFGNILHYKGRFCDPPM